MKWLRTGFSGGQSCQDAASVTAVRFWTASLPTVQTSLFIYRLDERSSIPGVRRDFSFRYQIRIVCPASYLKNRMLSTPRLKRPEREAD
jgi:hypothetical protein